MKIEIKQIKSFDEALINALFSSTGNKPVNPNPQFFQDSKNIFLVVYQNQTPAGFLYAYLLPSPKTTKPKMFLYSIDIFPDFRRQNLATQLIEKLKAISVENNCTEIFVLTNQKNIAAMKLYKKTGGSRENDDDVLFVYQSL